MELIRKAKEILEGWENFIEKPEVVEKKAQERAKICARCEKARKAMLLVMIKDDFKEIEGFYCGECKCPLSALVRSSKPCKLEKWQ